LTGHLLEVAVEKSLILVDESDNEIGAEEAAAVHKEGKLHRAFSIFVFTSHGKLLLQRRAVTKNHSGGLWTNTCCSHPSPGDSLEKIVHTRLREEMGFDCELKKVLTFTYKAKFDNGLSEYEYDHLFVGVYDGEPKPDPTEVEGFKWMSIEELKADIRANPDAYTFWFKVAFDRLLPHLPLPGVAP
jgi:isopentenyl-diphosphate delta-isomerase